MMFRLTVVALLGLTLPQASYASPPKELTGKTVSITWTETRDQKPVGEEEWRQVSGTITLNLYFSEAGRIFNNVSYSTRGGTAERKGEIAGSGRRSISVNGRSLLVLMPWGTGGATRITGDFDPSFSNCNVQVTRAKESSGTVVRSYSDINKRVNETRSVHVEGASCGIRTGNVFAN
jgi:hypothetical protein